MQKRVKDVTFEGQVFSAIDVDTNETLWYLHTGFQVFEIKKPEHISFKETIEASARVVEEVKQKPDVVEIVRYFRRWNNKLDQYESRGGVTAICRLDYKKGLMYVYPSFCSDDENFSKQSGLEVAKHNQKLNIGIVFEFNRDVKIENNIACSIEDNRYSYTTTDVKQQTMLRHRLNIAVNDISDDITAAIV
jgi:ADP-dependent phosphofructokinase/glucokinase